MQFDVKGIQNGWIRCNLTHIINKFTTASHGWHWISDRNPKTKGSSSVRASWRRIEPKMSHRFSSQHDYLFSVPLCGTIIHARANTFNRNSSSFRAHLLFYSLKERMLFVENNSRFSWKPAQLLLIGGHLFFVNFPSFSDPFPIC